MINVNKVYRSVLSIINKEQRGYLTPDQFNKIARQVQLDIFENTFYEYNKSLNNNKSFKINEEYANTPRFIKEKIDLFSIKSTLTATSGVVQLPSPVTDTEIYRIIGVSTASNNSILEASKAEIYTLVKSKLTKPTVNYPIYCRTGYTLNVYPTTIASVNIDYIRMPLDPKWGYITAGVAGNYQYDSVNSVNFELHPSEEVTLIIGILQYAGVTIKDSDIVSVATSEKTNKTTIENQ